nr:hypothetical protein HK105_005857 [Polyrhizophydium stewartii]
MARSVSAAFLNEKQIEADTKRLQAQLAIYQRQTRQWLALLDQFNSSLKARGSNMNADLAVLLHPTAEGEPQDG